jgi:hypothetical protein
VTSHRGRRFGFRRADRDEGAQPCADEITDAVVFLTRITAQGTSHVVNQPSFWVQVIPATAAVATTIGMLIALYVAIVGELTVVATAAVAGMI